MPRPGLTRTHVVRALSASALGVVALAPVAAGSRVGPAGADRWTIAPTRTAVVGYGSLAQLGHALRGRRGTVVRAIPELGVAEVRPAAQPRYFASATARLPGIEYVEPTVTRDAQADPALQSGSTNLPGGVLEWQYLAAHENEVPSSVLRAASALTIAVIDTGADVRAPDIAAKDPITGSVVSGSKDVRDSVGHGTFVAALAAGSVTNEDGIAGFGGDAKLMIVQASRTTTAFSDFDEAAAIVWAVDHGARILNLSLGGPDTSTTERRAIDYAAKHGVLIVAAIGNERDAANPVEYPAALVQPVGSNGRGGVGLSVGASDENGRPAEFSNTGSHLSLLAPGVSVLSALSSTGTNVGYVSVPVPGSSSGLYAFSSGTSFAAPEVAGAAALVWAANQALSAQQVASILKQTASNGGSWNDRAGYGVIDVAAAVQQAGGGRAETTASSATLTLTASPPGGRAPLDVSVRAALAPARRGRPLALEAFSAGHWRAAASAQTNAAGRASWSFRLQPGLYRLRARFTGDAVLRPTLSPTLTVTAS